MQLLLPWRWFFLNFSISLKKLYFYLWQVIVGILKSFQFYFTVNNSKIMVYKKSLAFPVSQLHKQALGLASLKVPAWPRADPPSPLPSLRTCAVSAAETKRAECLGNAEALGEGSPVTLLAICLVCLQKQRHQQKASQSLKGATRRKWGTSPRRPLSPRPPVSVWPSFSLGPSLWFWGGGPTSLEDS